MASSLPRLPMRRQALLIEHTVDGEVVARRPMDGYIHATALYKKADKLFADYNRLFSTQTFLKALSTDMGIYISALIQSLKGGVAPKQQGTWVHPKVAINLTQWLSPQFAVQVSTRVFDWMEGGVAAKTLMGLFQRTCAGGGSIAEANYRRLTAAKKLKADGVFYARFSR